MDDWRDVMKHGPGILILPALCAAALAADPPPAAPAASADATRKAAAKPLDLRVGDIRKYMMPKDFEAAVQAPDADQDAVVVRGRRELLPMKSLEPVPGGLFAPFWMLANPTQAWRALVPDVNAKAAGPPEVVPKPEFRWGP
jgi:hypothetical protein